MRLKQISVFLAFLVVFLLSFHTITDSDMGYHLNGGRWMIENKIWPTHDTFTYTVTDHDYIDIHWLYQLSAFCVYSFGGNLAYVLFHSLFILLAFYLSFNLARQQSRDIDLLALIMLIGAFASDHRFSVRPEVISWSLMMLLLTVLEKGARHRFSHLYFLPAIMLIWVNIQGIFVIGLGVICCYVIDDMIRHRRIHRPLWLYSISAFLAIFVNPYGWKGAFFPVILSRRLSGENRFAETIGEFLSPWGILFNHPDAYSLYMLIAFISLLTFTFAVMIITVRKRPVRHWLIFLMFGILASQAIRNIPVFTLITLPIVAAALNDIKDWLRLKGLFDTKLIKIPAMGKTFVILFLALFSCHIVINGSWHYRSGKSWHLGYSLTNRFLPVKAADFLKNTGVNGRILNELRQGGYLGWILQKPVFIDGRLEVMEHDFYKIYQEISPKNIQATIKQFNIDHSLFDIHVKSGWFGSFMHLPEWRCIYLDSRNAVFIADSMELDNIPSINCEQVYSGFCRASRDIDTSDEAIESLIDHVMDQNRFLNSVWIRGFSEEADLLFDQGKTMLAVSKPEHARELFKKAAITSKGYHSESWYQLARLTSGKLSESCLEVVIHLEPDHHKALLDLERLKMYQRAFS